MFRWFSLIWENIWQGVANDLWKTLEQKRVWIDYIQAMKDMYESTMNSVRAHGRENFH